MMTTVEINLPLRKRLGLLFSGRLFAQVILTPSWWVHLAVRPGLAWIYHNGGNDILRHNMMRLHDDSPAINDGGTLIVEEPAHGR